MLIIHKLLMIKPSGDIATLLNRKCFVVTVKCSLLNSGQEKNPIMINGLCFCSLNAKKQCYVTFSVWNSRYLGLICFDIECF